MDRYRLDETSGTAIINESGNNGIYTAGFTRGLEGIKGKCYLALGEATPPDATLNFTANTGSYTISFWIKRLAGGDATSEKIFASTNFTMTFEGAGKTFQIYDGAGHNFDTTYTTLGAWAYLTYVQDSVNAKELFYVNGALYATDTVDPDKNLPATVYFGSDSAGGNRNFSGFISDICVYPSVLSAEEIADLYRNYFSGTIRTKVINKNYPSESGLTARTQKQAGRISNLIPEAGSLVPRRQKAGI